MPLHLSPRPRNLARASEASPWWRRVDVILLGSTLAIALSGLLMVLSATRSGYGEEGYTGLAARQAVWLVGGLCVMAITALYDYRKLHRALPWIYCGLSTLR